MSAQKIVRINLNSEDRIKTGQETTTNFKINLKDIFNSGQSGRKIKMAVNRVRIPGSWYNINPLTNTFTVWYRDLAAPAVFQNFTITIPQGNYTSSQIASELNSQFDAEFGAGVFVWTVSAQQQSYNIENTSGTSYELVLVFTDPNAQNTAGNSASPIVGYPVPSLVSVVGTAFEPSIGTTRYTSGILSFPGASSLNTGVFDVTYPSSFVIRGSLGTINTYDSKYESSGLIFETVSIPAGLLGSDVIYYASDPIDLTIEVINPFSTFINFTLTDIRNNIIDLNQHNWDMDMVAQWAV